ncbi:MAG TPA: hypothetical protein VGH89_14210 [Pseudonocardia sp.]
MRTHVVVGDPAQVRAAVLRAYADGRLVRLIDGEELLDGSVRVRADLIDPTSPDRLCRGRPWLIGASVLAGAAAVAAVAWLVVMAIGAAVAAFTAAVAWVHTHQMVIGGVALMLALLVGGGASGADGHSGGCRR